MQQEKIPLLVIGGPTASGKTALAISFAQKYDGEVVSADSMQMYRGMDIATAKPSMEERGGVPHHLFDILEPGESSSVADYVPRAHTCIRDIYARGKLPILAGGTGLYVNSVIQNILFSPMPGEAALRRALSEQAQREGPEALHRELAAVDPEAAAAIHPNNLGRVIRALEVYRLTGITMTESNRRSRELPSPYEVCLLVLQYRDRQRLYDKINSRVDAMLEHGLLEEAQKLLAEGLSPTAAQAIGYKELSGYFAGQEPLCEAVEHIKRETRRYAKRQITWFSHMAGARMLYLDNYADFKAFFAAAEQEAAAAGVLPLYKKEGQPDCVPDTTGGQKAGKETPP